MIYLDNHATTQLDPRVLKAMMPYLKERYGNASSRTHSLGLDAAEALERARVSAAKLIGAEPREVLFTSGATEANNLALKGAAYANRRRGDHLISVVTEHKSVLDPLKRLSQEGFRVTLLPVDREGFVDLRDLEKAVTDRTILISVMLANNEIGTIQPVSEVGRIAAKKDILFHCDAVAAAGKVTIDVEAMGVDLLSISAHKMNGPKGTGLLYIRKKGKDVKIWPLLDGGGQEAGLRAGTVNVPGVVAFGAACEISRKELKAEARRLETLRDTLKRGLLQGIPGVRVNGSLERRLPHNLHVSIPGIDAAGLMKSLRGVALSSGSACLSTSPTPSHVLGAIGLTPEEARGSLRFGLGRFNTPKDVRVAVSKVAVMAKTMIK
ncbi:MAG TPA: cysteine desulfurase family protein [Candidatus Omnitrophota bacterium]|nr:cysteine desulfurase family protein [Candidatus Omnitrophota bacterium]